MIDKSFGEYVLYCDICGEEEEHFDHFDNAVDFKDENGWASRKEPKGWKDICPECKE